MIAHQRVHRGPEETATDKQVAKSKRTPGLKNPGVFVYVKEKMKENKWTKEKQREWLKQHVLTPEQVNKRIQEKLERGFLIAQAIKQRDNRLQGR